MKTPQNAEPADLLKTRTDIAAAEARIAKLEKRRARAQTALDAIEEALMRERAGLDALHRYDSVFTSDPPKET
jgi:outer membrane protein TolC